MSNGSLMRCTPMAVFTSSLTPHDARVLIEAEVSISHPNQSVKDCEYLYQIAIHFLLNNFKNKNRAYDAFEYVYNDHSQVMVNGETQSIGSYISDRDQSEHSCQKWLTIAFEMSKEADKCG